METDIQQDESESRSDVLQRLKGSATSASLTLMSIIQGVALAALAALIATNYPHFTLVEWLDAAGSFVLLIVAWNQVTMDTITWVQLPDMTTALIPFIVGAFELFLIQAINHSNAAWHIGAAGMAALSSIGIWVIDRSIAMHQENAPLFDHLKTYRKAGQQYNVFGTVLLLLLALVAVLGGFARLDAAIAHPGVADSVASLLACGFLVGFLLRHLFYWQVITAYAQALPEPVKKHRLG